MSQLITQRKSKGVVSADNFFGGGGIGVIRADTLEPHNYSEKQMGLRFLSQRRVLWLGRGMGYWQYPDSIWLPQTSFQSENGHPH